MYPDNNEERRMHPDSMDGNMRNSPFGEPSSNNAERYVNGAFYREASDNEAEYNNSGNNEQAYSEPANADPNYNAQAYAQPVNNEQVYYNEPVYGRQPYNEPTYNELHDVPRDMYSPGICVNQPYPRPRNEENEKDGASRENNKGLVGFLRALALVVVCAAFSAAAAYTVIDYRINRGDFEQAPNQVILGNVAERRQDDSPTAPVVTLVDTMSAQDIYDMARTQVVGINTEAPGFLGIPELSGSTTPISGSGFIISNDGYILTNYHVIEIAHKSDLAINVVLNDGTSYEAEVVGFDASNDVAIIKIDATGLNASIIGNSDNVRVGQTVYAVGNPFGDLVYTMTDGIVSALDRVVSVDGKSIRTFQFSAAVNSGNSGGPIYNTYGEIIGIVTAKVVRGNVEGIGFAIPINDAIDIASELIEYGYISGRPLIGITGENVSEANAYYFGWVLGVRIRSVTPDSAAEAAGIIVGDIITALDGKKIDTMEDLRFALRDHHRAGETATITIWRDGDSHNLQITFDEDEYAGQP